MMDLTEATERVAQLLHEAMLPRQDQTEEDSCDYCREKASIILDAIEYQTAIDHASAGQALRTDIAEVLGDYAKLSP